LLSVGIAAGEEIHLVESESLDDKGAGEEAGAVDEQNCFGLTAGPQALPAKFVDDDLLDVFFHLVFVSLGRSANVF
jgi:hypothetical protein